MTRDRFDAIPDEIRVGAHRGPRRRGRGWIVFAWAALASGLLVVVGLYVVTRTVPGFDLGLFPTATASAEGPAAQKTAAPVTDPKSVDPALNLSISVLNGTGDDALDSQVADRLKGEGWPVAGFADADTRDLTATTVYYSSSQLEGVARGLVKELGVGSVQLAESVSGSPVTVVLGSDYKG